MLNLNSILLFSQEPEKLAEFYEKVLGTKPGWDEGGYKGFMIGNGFLTIGPHDKVLGKNLNPERMMFNLETADVESEFERIKALETKVISAPYSPDEDKKMLIATFEDIDGNYFQLVSPMKM